MLVNWNEKISNYHEEARKERSERHSHVKNHPAHHPLREPANPLNPREWILSKRARCQGFVKIVEENILRNELI